MATKEGKQWWDPYETCHRRQFVYRPVTATETLLCPASTCFIDSYSQSGPFGSSVYSKDFCWKPTCRPESVRTGQRRNNPHHSQSFMMWPLSGDAAQSPEYVRFHCKHPPSDAEVCKALAAQYRSIYRCDFMGMPQGCDSINNAERGFEGRRVCISTDTEMRDNYRQPNQKPELLGGRAHSRCNRTSRGIVPTVVQRHIRAQQRGSDLTTCDRFCGKRVSDVASVTEALQPRELQQLCRALPEKGKEAVKCVLSKESYPDDGGKGNTFPPVNPCAPEWISGWTGPL